jgi:hypothetical protein
MRMLYQLRFRGRIRKRIPQYRFFLADDSLYVSGHSIDDDYGRNFTARNNKIADRNFRRCEMLDDSLIDALVPAADQYHLIRSRKPQRLRLIESAPRGAEYHDFGLRGFPSRLDRSENRFGLENHPFAAAEGPVVHRPMAIRGGIPQIVNSDPNESLFAAAPYYSEIKRPLEEFREDRDDVEFEHGPPTLLVQIPQAFRQVYFDPALIQIDLAHVRLCERNQCFLILAIDLQNLSLSRSEYIRNHSNVFAVYCKNLAAFQLKSIKRTVCGRRQCVGRNPDFTADIFFGFRNRIDSPQFSDAPPVLPAKELKLRIPLGALPGRKDDPPPGLEDGVVFEQLLDPDLTFQTLGFGNPGDGYIGAF